jgi:hypothetical protein
MFWNTSKFVRSFAPRSWQKIILNAKSLQAVQSSRHPRRRAWLGDNSSQQNENTRLDTGRAGSSYSHSSGVLTALVSQEGIRCVSPFRRRGNSGAAPQLSAVSRSLKCHWALRCEVWEGGERRRPASQETCLNDVILPACGVRARGGLPLR